MKALAEQIAELDQAEIYGRVVGVRGLMVEAAGPLQAMSIGARVTVEAPDRTIPCEVVGFSGSIGFFRFQCAPFAALEGVRRAGRRDGVSWGFGPARRLSASAEVDEAIRLHKSLESFPCPCQG